MCVGCGLGRRNSHDTTAAASHSFLDWSDKPGSSLPLQARSPGFEPRAGTAEIAKKGHEVTLARSRVGPCNLRGSPATQTVFHKFLNVFR